MVDSHLIRAAQEGDQAAFARIAAGLARPFLATSRRILHDLDLAEDATQEALVGVWRGLPRLREPSRFDAWAYRLLVRACYAEVTRVRRWAPNLRTLPAEPPDPTDAMGELMNRDELERAFRRLSIDQRTVIVLRYYLDLSLEQVADVLDVPPGTAGSRLHYALQELRTAVDADARPAAHGATR